MTMKEKIQRSIEQKISEWQEDDIYAVSLYMRMVIAFIVITVLVMFSFWVLGLIISSRNTTVSEDTPRLTDNFGGENEELPIYASVEAEEQTSMSSEPKEAESNQSHWQVYIQPDMPEPYIEVLKLYEKAMNAGVKDFNDEEVMDRFNPIDGEWRYLYDLYCRRLAWAVEHNEADDNYRYSLKDLTGDGFPELILGYYLDSFDETTPEVIYYYSETEGIMMEYLSDYYIMTLYEGGIIEYISGGVTYTKTYLQFQAETESWELAARVVVDWDSQTDSDRGYCWGDDVGGDLTDNEPMSEEEYQKIMAQYAKEPMELEWTSLVLSAE